MQFQAISVSVFKFSGGECPDPPSRLKQFFSPLGANQNFFRFNKTQSNFGLDPRLVGENKFDLDYVRKVVE